LIDPIGKPITCCSLPGFYKGPTVTSRFIHLNMVPAMGAKTSGNLHFTMCRNLSWCNEHQSQKPCN